MLANISNSLHSQTTPISHALRLEAVAKQYGAVSAVKSLSLDIKTGEFFTLLGPSGSGKTTTLLMIAGFESISSGEIYLGKAPVSGIPAHKRGIGVVFQNYALFPHLSVFENVAFALRNLKWKEADIESQVREMLELVQLQDMENRLPTQLSGGQQQRVALARSLAFRPSVLLLDEPVGALDRKLREHMLIEFRRIHQKLGTTMVYVTHDQDEALVMSDRVGIMHNGELVRVGSPMDIYEDPQSKFVAEFIGETNLLSGTVQPTGRIRLDGGSDEIAVSHDQAPGAKVSVVVRPEKITMSADTNNSDTWNHLSAKIEGLIYVGDATKYRCRTGAGHVIRSKQLNCFDADPAVVGQNVVLSWHTSDCRVLPQS